MTAHMQRQPTNSPQPTNTLAVQPQPKPSALAVMASQYSMDPATCLNTLKNTVFKGCTNEELAVLVVVCNEYKLNPFLREIYAFRNRDGGITAVVGVDGWTRAINRHPDFDGADFEWEPDGSACTCTMYAKGRSRPIRITEFLDECQRNTDNWKNMPRRMLRHRAWIQAGRLAFGITGIRDEDEIAAEVIVHPASASVVYDTPQVAAPAAPAATKSADEAAEAEAGLAPMPKPADAPKPVESSQKQQLEELVVANGYTYSHFQKWAIDSGNIEDCDSRASFSEIPEPIAKRILRSPGGLLKGLATAKQILEGAQ